MNQEPLLKFVTKDDYYLPLSTRLQEFVNSIDINTFREYIEDEESMVLLTIWALSAKEQKSFSLEDEDVDDDEIAEAYNTVATSLTLIGLMKDNFANCVSGNPYDLFGKDSTWMRTEDNVAIPNPLQEQLLNNLL